MIYGRWRNYQAIRHNNLHIKIKKFYKLVLKNMQMSYYMKYIIIISKLFVVCWQLSRPFSLWMQAGTRLHRRHPWSCWKNTMHRRLWTASMSHLCLPPPCMKRMVGERPATWSRSHWGRLVSSPSMMSYIVLALHSPSISRFSWTPDTMRRNPVDGIYVNKYIFLGT